MSFCLFSVQLKSHRPCQRATEAQIFTARLLLEFDHVKLLLLATVAHNQQLRLPLFPLKELSGSVTTGSTTKRLQRNSFETLSVWAGRQVSLGEGKRWSKRKAERSSSAIGCSVAMLHWLLQKHLNARESMNEKPGCTHNLIISTYTQTLTLQCYTTEAMQLRHKSPSNNIWQQHGGQAGYLAVTH